MVHATNRKVDGMVDGTEKEISSHLTYKWRVRINQAGLYNKKEGAPKGGAGKKGPKTRASQPTSKRSTPGVTIV